MKHVTTDEAIRLVWNVSCTSAETTKAVNAGWPLLRKMQAERKATAKLLTVLLGRKPEEDEITLAIYE